MREITAFNVGVSLRQAGRTVAGYLAAPAWLQLRYLSAEEISVRSGMGHDSWAYWLRRGYDDAGQPKGAAR